MVLGRLRDESGQATVELAITLPVAIVVAAIVINALLFMGECAAFDRRVPQVVRAYASALDYGQTQASAAELAEQDLNEGMSEQNVSAKVTVHDDCYGNAIYEATLEYHPTFFGLNMRSNLWGIELPALSHSTAVAFALYKPGVVL